LNFGTPTVTSSPDILAQLPPEMFLDAIAVPVDGPRAWDLDLAIRWAFPDHGATFRVTLANGVPTHVRDGSGEVSLTMTVPRAALAALATGDLDAAGAAGSRSTATRARCGRCSRRSTPATPISTSSSPSRLSPLIFGVEVAEFGARIAGGEVPVDLSASGATRRG
jgi:hypothetical protein